jgi:hypothetical protein
MACKMYHLASSFSFSGVTIGVEGPDVVSATSGRNGFGHCVLAEVRMEAERILGSFVLKKHGALKMVNLPNGGRLNRDFEQMGMAYAPSPLLGTEASQAVREKRKAEE